MQLHLMSKTHNVISKESFAVSMVKNITTLQYIEQYNIIMKSFNTLAERG